MAVELARAFAIQAAPGAAATYCLPSTNIGVTGVARGCPDVRPVTVRITGPFVPKRIPSRDSATITALPGLMYQGSFTFTPS